MRGCRTWNTHTASPAARPMATMASARNGSGPTSIRIRFIGYLRAARSGIRPRGGPSGSLHAARVDDRFVAHEPQLAGGAIAVDLHADASDRAVGILEREAHRCAVD